MDSRSRVDNLLRQVGRGVGGHVVVGCETHAAIGLSEGTVPDVLVRDCLHGSGGLGFGGLDGVLPAAFVRRNLAGGVGRVLVVREPVRLVEHDVVKHVAAVELLGVDAPEREAGRGLAVGDQVGALVRLHWLSWWRLLPFVTLVAMVVDFSLSLSPCPLTVVRVISTGVSWPGAPIRTCILSR